MKSLAQHRIDTRRQGTALRAAQEPLERNYVVRREPAEQFVRELKTLVVCMAIAAAVVFTLDAVLTAAGW